jgi:hypothetical protein
MIFLDAVVGGKPASLLPDCRKQHDPQRASRGIGHGSAPKPTGDQSRDGRREESDYITRDVNLRLSSRHWMNRRVLVMDISDASKRMGTHIDGFLGHDILRVCLGPH